MGCRDGRGPRWLGGGWWLVVCDAAEGEGEDADGMREDLLLSLLNFLPTVVIYRREIH